MAAVSFTTLSTKAFAPLPARSAGRRTAAVAPARASAFMGSKISMRSAAVRPSTKFAVRAAKEETNFDADEMIKTLTEKWDAVENKSSVAVYGGGAVVVLWLSATIVGAINSVPLIPKVMELVGLGYSAWFVYRYLLFKTSRKELLADIEELKSKVAGAADKE